MDNKNRGLSLVLFRNWGVPLGGSGDKSPIGTLGYRLADSGKYWGRVGARVEGGTGMGSVEGTGRRSECQKRVWQVGGRRPGWSSGEGFVVGLRTCR